MSAAPASTALAMIRASDDCPARVWRESIIAAHVHAVIGAAYFRKGILPACHDISSVVGLAA